MPLSLGDNALARNALGENEINLREYWQAIIRRRRLVVAIVCILSLTTVVVSLLFSDIYQGKAVLIPLSKSTSGLQAALGELGSLLPIGLTDSENPSTRLLAILQSRTLVETVIQRLGLLPLLYADVWDANTQQWLTDDPPTMQDAVRLMLTDVVASELDETKGILNITANHADPVLAAAIVNQFIAVLQQLLNENAFTLAKKNRVFIETQLQQTRKDLAVAEEALQQFEQSHGIVSLEAQAQVAVSALAGLEAQIMAKEVQLGVLQRALTKSSREVYFLQEEIQGLRSQLARLQQGVSSSLSVPTDLGRNHQLFPAFDKAPDIKLQYARLQREALIQNKLFTLLVQQYEQAKIEEVRDETAFQILDRAIPPDEKAKPNRKVIVILAAMTSFFLGVFVAFVRDAADTSIRTREQVESRVGISVLAAIPSPLPQPRRRWHQKPWPEARLLVSPPPHTPYGEAFRYLYARLKHHHNGHGVQVILLTSPGAEEETGTVLVNLAVVTASLGEKTLLVDSNLQQPALHSLLHCSLSPGLIDTLASPERWQENICSTSVENLHLLTAGTVSVSTRLALESLTFDHLLTHLREVYKWVLFAAPPVLSATDAAVLSTKVDATCLVLTCHVSRFETIAAAKTALEAVEGKVVGAILLDCLTTLAEADNGKRARR
jgi:capsular exopolysaccharide synthesis family protein